MMKQGLVAWTWETHGRFAEGGEGSCGEQCPRPGRPRPATAHSTLIPETMMVGGAGALKPGPAGHRRCRGGCGLDRAGPSNRRSTIGMKDADLLFPAKSMDCAKFVFIDGLDLQNTGFATLPKKCTAKETHSA